MDSCTNPAKRKKRKTRKCLDEIRKRSRLTSHMLQDDKLCDIYSRNVRNGAITNSRLTIRMFPNAIQSETITRPGILEVEHKKSINLDELNMGTKFRSMQSSDVIRIPLSVCSTIEYERNTKENVDFDTNMTRVESINNVNDESLELFSSTDELANKSPRSIETRSCTASSLAAQSVEDDYAYSLYEEFMSEVPLCLQQNSKLNQQDVMKKNKTLLQNLFIQSCYRHCEDNILECTKQDIHNSSLYYTTSTVINDPINYIRLNHIQGDNHVSRWDEAVSESGSTCGSAPRPASSLTSTDAPLDVAVEQSPDYTYYPHKLN